ncbi:Ca-activated chloride channel family protein [Thiohalospira halophila DSM 15071]|uniref:Ca-activated chloride channel family protein n=1 Tax=Thiohalospira halophila DSM 15071 TaxID=1123397 RepID=A0A1I1NN81_9GAMM|nr:tetratricopeptide repeat protein [Thiohalospira halophila]SFC98905.1 Ca-activated chloride channel family protein [Thiohalospira halophila DSM 15071]
MSDWLSHWSLARPEWLWLLLPLAALWGGWLLRGGSDSPWRGVIEPRLLAHLTGGEHRDRRRLAAGLLAAGWLLAVIALAGPRLEGSTTSLYQRTSAAMVVLDLSTAGAPSEETRTALRDWLRTSRLPQVGLLVAAGTAHEVVPPTPDAALVRRQLRWLAPDTMPRPGRDLATALERAGAVLERTGIENGAVILVSAPPPDPAAVTAARRLIEQGVAVHRVGHGGEAPALRDVGGEVHAAAGLAGLDPLPRGPGAFRDRRIAGEGTSAAPLTALLVLMALVVALGARRGWLLLLPLLAVPPPAPADPWQTPDQAAMAAYEAGDYREAAALFEDPEWRGMALYRADRWLDAAEAFARVDHPRAHYNRGNALLRAGRPGEAIAAWETALDGNPDLEDARINRDLVQEYLDAREEAVRRAQDRAEDEREAVDHPGPLLQEDPAGFWRRKFEQDLRRRDP